MTPALGDAAREVERKSLRGVLTACALLAAWLVWVPATLFFARPAKAWAPLALVSAFLYTGLFITGHDALHGTVAPGHPRLNRALGTLALWLFAAFDLRRLEADHSAHHRAPASAADPDFHPAGHESYLRWLFAFGLRYLTVRQILLLALFAQIPLHLLQLPLASVLLFWVAPPLLATVQLFTFGTYLPHRARDFADQHRAESSSYPVWLSFLSCYHFGYHHEHHAQPHLAWWQLPKARSARSSHSKSSQTAPAPFRSSDSTK